MISRRKTAVILSAFIAIVVGITFVVWRTSNTPTPSEKAQLLTETAVESRQQIIDNLTDESKAALEAGLSLTDGQRAELAAKLPFGKLAIEWAEISYKKQAGSATAEDLARMEEIERHFLAYLEKTYPFQKKMERLKKSLAKSQHFLLETLPLLEFDMTGDNAQPLVAALRKAAEEEISAKEEYITYLLETKDRHSSKSAELSKARIHKTLERSYVFKTAHIAIELDGALEDLRYLKKQEQAASNLARQIHYAEGRRLLEENIEAAKQFLAAAEAVSDPIGFGDPLEAERDRLEETEDAYDAWIVSVSPRGSAASARPAPEAPEAAPPKSPPAPSASLAQEFAVNTGREAPELPPNRTGIADENLLMLLMAREYEREGYEDEARGIYERVRGVMSAEELERALRFLEENAEPQDR